MVNEHYGRDRSRPAIDPNSPAPKLAWQRAWQVRGCPPEDLLLAHKVDPLLQEHLDGCLFCREYRETLGDLIAPAGPASPAEQTPADSLEVSPGQIWTLSRKLAGWGPKNRYYTPPLVLVLDILPCPSGLASEGGAKQAPAAVRVAQAYDDPSLAGPGDLVIGDNLFAEAWNTYTVHRSHLGTLIASLSSETASRTAMMGADDSFAEINPFSILAAFRRLEIEVAAFFAMQALNDLLPAREGDLLDEVASFFPDHESLVSSLPEAIRWPQKGLSVLETLALAELPEAELPLAASEELPALPVNVLVLQGEAPTVMRALAFLTVWRRQQGGFLVGGRIEHGLSSDAAIFCRWSVDDLLIEPGEVMLDPESRYFRVFFESLSERQASRGQLAVLVCSR